MENPTTLLVAIMYVTIVATGLMTVLMSLSDIVARKRRDAPIHVAWLIFLLLMYFSFFWETTAILNVEGWGFLTFIGFIAGPILMLFATNLIVAPAGEDGQQDLFQHFLSQCSRFFGLMCAVQVWVVCLDVIIGPVSYLTYLTAGTGLLFFVLMFSKSYRVHSGGAIVLGIVILSRLIMQAF